jgi:molybdate transport system substrate-binding protein
MVENRRTVLQSIGAWAAGSLLLRPRTALAQHQMSDAPHMATGDGKTLVFAAATLQPALDEIVRAHKSAGEADVTVAYGPTPILAKNIEQGAPADLFFSADIVWMDYLAERKLIRSETRVDIVRNEVVLVQGGSAADGPQVAIDESFPIATVVGSGPIAMCNPDSHPAGRFAKTSLEQLGLWQAIAGKIAIVENPQAAVAMVARGDAPAAVVFVTDTHGVGGVRVSGTFPAESHAPIIYPAAVTAEARHPADAERLLAYLHSAPAREIFDRFGYR